MQNKQIINLTQGAVIAALYAVLTVGQNLLIPGSTSMAVQFRAAEVLCMLACFTPVAIPGLTIGCLLANLLAGLGAIDLILGPLASFMAALTMYLLRNLQFKGLPIVASLMPAVWNGLIVGLEIAFFFSDTGFTFTGFLVSGGCVALGELVVLIVLGLPFYKLIDKTGVFRSKKAV